MSFKKGQSGNPTGRPRGIPDKRTQLRSLLEPHSEQLVSKAVEKALEGDTTALRLCLERIIPPFKAVGETVNVSALKAASTATERAELVLTYLAEGDLTPDDSNVILGALVRQLKVAEFDDIERRLQALEMQG